MGMVLLECVWLRENNGEYHVRQVWAITPFMHFITWVAMPKSRWSAYWLHIDKPPQRNSFSPLRVCIYGGFKDKKSSEIPNWSLPPYSLLKALTLICKSIKTVSCEK